MFHPLGLLCLWALNLAGPDRFHLYNFLYTFACAAVSSRACRRLLLLQCPKKCSNL